MSKSTRLDKTKATLKLKLLEQEELLAQVQNLSDLLKRTRKEKQNLKFSAEKIGQPVVSPTKSSTE